MDAESDGEEFFDAAEYPAVSTPEKEDSETRPIQYIGSPIIG